MTLPLFDNAKNAGLISAEDLFNILQLNPERIKLVDATYPANPSLPGIGEAVTFDIDDIADPESPMAHMLPSPELFAEKVGALGIGNDDFIVCYDQSGFIMAASRAWWMFRVFGHDNVVVLDGGLSGWVEKNYPVQVKKSAPERKIFQASFRPELVLSYAEMADISAGRKANILDARPFERFAPSHIENSTSLPVIKLINDRREMISSAAFKNALNQNGINLDSPIVTTCGSGVTACGLALALFREGKRDVPVYDGSWTEWSRIHK